MTTPAAPAVPPTTAQPIDFRALIISLLALAPAEGATEILDAEIETKLKEVIAASSSTADQSTALATAQKELEEVRGQYEVLFKREQDAQKRVAESAADEILAQYENRIATPEAKARLRSLLLTDREAGIEILNGLPAAAAAPVEEEPPNPMHKEGAEQVDLTPEQKLAEADKLIAELRKTKPAFKSYDDARNEIRRLRPELFA